MVPFLTGKVGGITVIIGRVIVRSSQIQVIPQFDQSQMIVIGTEFDHIAAGYNGTEIVIGRVELLLRTEIVAQLHTGADIGTVEKETGRIDQRFAKVRERTGIIAEIHIGPSQMEKHFPPLGILPVGQFIEFLHDTGGESKGIGIMPGAIVGYKIEVHRPYSGYGIAFFSGPHGNFPDNPVADLQKAVFIIIEYRHFHQVCFVGQRFALIAAGGITHALHFFFCFSQIHIGDIIMVIIV